MNKILLLSALVLVPLMGLMIVGSANYMGVCVPQMRILSDEEKIYAAFNFINQEKTISSYWVGNDCKSSECKKIPYESFAQFKKENPDSCFVERVSGTSSTNPIGSFWDKVFGLYLGEVSCGYNVDYYNDLGKKKSFFFKRTGDSTRIYITNCGEASVW